LKQELKLLEEGSSPTTHMSVMAKSANKGKKGSANNNKAEPG
jgi:hypothetical protein